MVMGNKIVAQMERTCADYRIPGENAQTAVEVFEDIMNHAMDVDGVSNFCHSYVTTVLTKILTHSCFAKIHGTFFYFVFKLLYLGIVSTSSSDVCINVMEYIGFTVTFWWH